MYRYIKKGKGNTKGFTLVETMVVLTILGILLAITAGGLIGYFRHANFKKNNEYAQTIFTAAQSSFTYSKTSGELDDLLAVLDTDTYNRNNSFSQRMITNGAVFTDRDRLYTLTFDKGSDPEKYTGAYRTVFDMISAYVYDHEILDAPFTVEFDPVDGKILGVCYDDKANSFYYGGATGETKETRIYNIYDRDREERYKNLIGYYGIDTLSARAPETGGRPVINNQELVNSDSLYLKWQLSSQYANAGVTEQLAYHINLYKKSQVASQDDKLAASFTVNDTSLGENIIKAQDGTASSELFVKADVTLYADDGTVATTKKGMQFKAYMSKSRVLYLVLDGADLGSDAQVGTVSDYNKNYDTTYSIKRFALGSSKIYARIQATGNNYKSSAWKQTKTEHTYFASEDVKDGNKTYEIANARHLFNMRFTEAEEKEENLAYVQSKDFAWDGDNSLISSENLFNGMQQVTTYSQEYLKIFPTIEQLHSDHSYSSEENHKYKMTGLNLGNNKTGNNLIGLFGINNGSISDVTFSKAKVTGADYVGCVAGVNGGGLENITVDADSKVTGSGDYVGGITGSDQSGYSEIQVGGRAIVLEGNERVYKTLTNRAEVSGQSFVGGIVGYIYGVYRPTIISLQRVLSVEDCSNAGYVYGTKEDGQGIGGIVGYNKKTNIKGCTSEPNIKEEQIKDIKEHCKGDFVGGIVGFNEDGTLTDCATQSDGAKAYVVGRNYVGGIVGLQTGDLVLGYLDTTITLDGNSAMNRANVVGKQYVGGIVGVNARISGNVTTDDNGKPTVHITSEPKQTNLSIVRNWTNRGVVLATDSYAGGITGYNGGKIENSTTNVDTNAVSGDSRLTLAREIGSEGSYIGGIAGYNSGSITSSSTKKVNAVAAGRSYVGGMVGYEASTGTLSQNMTLTGGYVDGTYFAGGVIGLNRNNDTYTKTFYAKPTKIQGKLYVGGIYGGNIISDGGTLRSEVNNSLGNVTGKAFVGGVIGYNKLVSSGYDTDELSKTLCKSGLASESLKTIENTVKDVDNTAITSKQLTIGNQNGETIQSHLNKVEAELYVGGVIGYNAGKTKLSIYHVTNKTAVKGTSHVSGNHEKTYSYAGGMTGLVTSNMIIDHCANDSSGKVTTDGTYHGGIAEENLGIIRNCSADTFGSKAQSYVGGIVGVNDNQVTDCETTGTITGDAHVGGMAADNYGTITGATIKHNINGFGNGVGGVVGYNYADGTVTNPKIETSIRSKGNNVGGVIGINTGKMIVSDDVFIAGASVQGANNVGGFIGSHSGQTLSGLISEAKVDADSNAGGIVGHLSGKATIENCANTRDVTANKSGNAGGITSATYNGVKINNCRNTGTVLSAGGAAGAIVGTNAEGADISNPTVLGSVTGLTNVGGVSATNAGTITDATIEDVDLAKVSAGSKVRMGGVVGINNAKGTISRCITTADFALRASSDGGYYGGIAGENQGTVTGDIANQTTAFATISSGASTRTSAYMGGIVGENRGTVQYYEFSGMVQGNRGSQYGYGGIVGVNHKTVDHCGLVGDDTSIEAVGDSKDIVNVGGIVGRNESGSMLSHCYVDGGTVQTPTSLKGVGYVGGYCGYNLGTIRDNTTSLSTGKVTVQTYQGHVGGMVGSNGTGGTVTNTATGGGSKSGSTYTSNHTWKVIANNHATDNGTSGSIGYNSSSKDISALVNYADANKKTSGSNACGGIVGRMENQVSSTWRMLDCVNVGTITGYESTGGMIGRWKYKGGTIENCKNYGNIAGTTDVGGMVGDTYQVTDRETFTYNGCENHSNIKGSQRAVGGIFGGTGTSSVNKLNFNFYNCVNVGNISLTNTAAQSSSGIVGYLNIGKLQTTISKCRNYGVSTTGAKLGGIFGQATTGSVAIKDCFGVSDADYPITNSAYCTVQKGYYFGHSPEDPRGFSTMSLLGTEGTDGPQSNLYDGDLSTRHTRSNATGGKGDIVIRFANAIDVSKFSTYWFSGASKVRTYTYNIWYWSGDETTGTWVKANDATVVATGSKATETDAQKEAKVSNVAFPSGTKTNTIKIEILGNSDASTFISLWEMKLDDKPLVQRSDTSSAKVLLDVEEEGSGTYRAVNGFHSIKITGLPTNPLDITKSMSDVNRETAYSGIDPKLRLFYDNQYHITKLETPKNLNLTNSNGNYILNWDFDDTAFYYQMHIEIFDQQGDDTPSDQATINVISGNSATIPMEEEWSGKYMKISLKAMNGDDSDNDLENTKDSDPAYYPSSSSSVQIHKFLPAPQVHYEFIRNGATDTYKVVLDNEEDYYEKNADGTPDKSKPISANVHIMTGTSEFAVFDVHSQCAKYYTGTTNSTQYIAYATATGSDQDIYADSSRLARESLVLPRTTLAGAAITGCTYTGFSGLTPETLSYNLTLKKGSREIYYRSEFLIKDNSPDGLGIPVVVSSAKTRVTTMADVTVTLGGLPAEVSTTDEPVTVRSYPITSQNDVGYYTTVVAKDISAEQVKATYMDGTQLKEGYSVERNGSKDFTYTVYHSVLLEDEIYQNQILTQTYTAGGGKPTAQVAPELPATLVVDDKDQYTLTWDKDKTGSDYTNAKYQVVVKGTPIDDSDDVELWSTNETSDREKVLDGSDWQYKNIKLEVTRLGEQNTSGIVSKFGTTSKKEYPQKLRLPTVENLSVDLVDQNNLNYKIAWNAISKEEYGEHFDHYEVHITDTKAPTKTMTPIVVSGGIEATSTVVDLDQLKEDDVQITVRAVAKESSDLYRDGLESDGYNMSVPGRKATPDVSTLVLDKTIADILSVTAFEDTGFKLTMTSSTAEEGGYVVQSAIVEHAEDSLDESLPIESMNGDLQSSYKNYKDISYDYAGYYLKARIRSVNEGEISSKWSSVATLQLPKVRINTPGMVEGLENRIEEITPNGGDVIRRTIAYDALLWDVPSRDVEKIKDEKLHLESAEKDAQGIDTYDLTMTIDASVKADESHSPFTIQKQEEESGQPVQKPITNYEYSHNPAVSDTDTETVSSDTYTYEFGYERTLTWLGGSTNYTMKSKARLQAIVTTTTKKNAPTAKPVIAYSYKLVLPDITDEAGMEQVDQNPHRYTNVVTVMGEAKDTSRYANTYKEKWERTETEDPETRLPVYGTKITEDQSED